MTKLTFMASAAKHTAAALCSQTAELPGIFWYLVDVLGEFNKERGKHSLKVHLHILF